MKWERYFFAPYPNEGSKFGAHVQNVAAVRGDRKSIGEILGFPRPDMQLRGIDGVGILARNFAFIIDTMDEIY